MITKTTITIDKATIKRTPDFLPSSDYIADTGTPPIMECEFKLRGRFTEATVNRMIRALVDIAAEVDADFKNI